MDIMTMMMPTTATPTTDATSFEVTTGGSGLMVSSSTSGRTSGSSGSASQLTTGTTTSTTVSSHHPVMDYRIEDLSPDVTFVWRLYIMLRDSTEKGFDDIVAWRRSGTAFEVVDQKRFESNILSMYFNSTKYESFTRNLRGYGFATVAKRTFAHESFRRDDPSGCDKVVRVKSQKKRTKKSLAKSKNMSSATDADPKKTDGDVHMSMNSVSTLRSTGTGTTSPSLVSIASATPPVSASDMEPIPFADAMADLLLPSSSWVHEAAARDQSKHKRTVSMDGSYIQVPAEDFEPRSVEEMASEPNTWLQNTPGMSYELNCLFEYFSAGSLPIAFTFFDFTDSARMLGWAIVIIHFIECLLTNFGGETWILPWQPRIGRIQHHSMDQIIMHTAISSLLILGKDTYGPLATIAGLGLSQTQPIATLSTYKTHYNLFVRPNITSRPEQIQLEYYLNKALRDIFVGYQVAFVFLAGWYTMDLGQNSFMLMIGVFLFNMVPLLCPSLYWRHIGSRSAIRFHKMKNA